MYKKTTKSLAVLASALALAIFLSVPGPAMAAVHREKSSRTDIPAPWSETEKPELIPLPAPQWEEIQRVVDLVELEDSSEKSAEALSKKADTYPTGPAIPWENRGSVYAQGLHIGSCLGTLTAPGVSQEVWWDFDQAATDHPSKVCIWGYSGLPGEPNYATIVYDHNYQTGRTMAGLPAGTRITLDLSYGTYTYELIGSEIADNLPDSVVKRVSPTVAYRTGDTDTVYIGEFVSPSHPNGCIYDACHAGSANAGELWFVTCWPLDQKVTSQRLVIRFKSVDGSVLENWR